MNSKIRYYCLAILLVLLVRGESFPQVESLKSEITEIINQANGKVGVSIINLQNNDTLSYNGDGRFPMQSVFKFPLALAVMHEIDKGILPLDQKILLQKSFLHKNTWSPLRDKYPNGDVYITIRELLTYTVAWSDNNGCDMLFLLLGGPANVNQYIHSLGVTDISIAANEEEMHKDWSVQYTNWSTPNAMAKLLFKFITDTILTKASKNFLYDVMASTTTGPNRIRGELPDETIVAHKTGSSGVNESGIAAATNDVGIVTLPNGEKFIIVVFVSDSREDEATRDGVIAGIAKAVWDFYSEN